MRCKLNALISRMLALLLGYILLKTTSLFISRITTQDFLSGKRTNEFISCNQAVHENNTFMTDISKQSDTGRDGGNNARDLYDNLKTENFVRGNFVSNK